MSVASKLTKSVRQAKESVANQDDVTQSNESDPQSPQETKAVVKPTQKTERPKARKRLEPEAPIVPSPSRRVWPD